MQDYDQLITLIMDIGTGIGVVVAISLIIAFIQSWREDRKYAALKQETKSNYLKRGAKPKHVWWNK